MEESSSIFSVLSALSLRLIIPKPTGSRKGRFKNCSVFSAATRTSTAPNGSECSLSLKLLLIHVGFRSQLVSHPDSCFSYFPARTPFDHAFEEKRQAKTGLEAGRVVPSEHWVQQFSEGVERIYQQVRERQAKLASQVQDPGRCQDSFLLCSRPGDLVLLSTLSHQPLDAGARKQRERFHGPYVVAEQVHPNAYRLKGLPS